MVIPPDAFVIDISVPCVNVAGTGAFPVLPINNCPFASSAVADTGLVAFPISIPWSVNVFAPVPPLPTINVPV